MMKGIVCRKCGEKDYFHIVTVAVTCWPGGDVSCDIEDIYCGRCDALISHEVSSPEGEIVEFNDALIAFAKRVRIEVEPLVRQ